MKKFGLMSLIASATLFMALGAVSANASEMKCGAGKCGGSMKAKPAKKSGAGKCGDGKKEKSAKCGGEKQKKKKVMKCGAGKCGGN